MPPLYWEYKDLVTPSEVPDEFHFFVFMTMISALAGDRLYFREGNDVTYPNIWTMLVAESSVGRKSTSFRAAMKLLQETKKVNILASKGSPEGLFKELADHEGVGLLHHSELGTLLGAVRKDYLGGMVEELCEYYDPQSVALIKRLSEDEIIIEHLAVSWITATTPDSLNKGDALGRVETGFLPRWNIVFGGPPKDLIPFRPSPPVEEFDAYAEKLKKLIQGSDYEVEFNASAKRLYEGWYMIHRSQVGSGAIGFFHVRIFEVVKKYAILFAFINQRKIVEEDDMERAIKCGEYFFASAEWLLTKEIAENREERNMQKILKAIPELIKSEKSPVLREIYRKTHLTKAEASIAIENLLARGEVVKAAGSRDEYRLAE